MLTLAAALGWNMFQDQIMRATFVPSQRFTPPRDTTAPDYSQAASWVARPDLSDDPSRWTPGGVRAAEQPPLAVFYVPPTTYLRRDQWNAAMDDSDGAERLRLFTASQASAFNSVGMIWAPRYRQASIGAFLTNGPDAEAAREFAYRDVRRAFDAFLAATPASRPILLAGHSQGALHLMRLLHDRVAGTPLAKRIVAAYVVGWPVSIAADLPALGLPACAAPGQAGCILSWQTFSEPADPHMLRALYDASIGLTARAGAAPRCCA